MLNNENESDELEKMNNKNELTTIIRKLRRFITRKRYWFKKKDLNKGEANKDKEKEQPVLCY